MFSKHKVLEKKKEEMEKHLINEQEPQERSGEAFNLKDCESYLYKSIGQFSYTCDNVPFNLVNITRHTLPF